MQISLEQIYYVSQLISTLVLLVSVIYLGRQTHLVAKGQLAQMHQSRSEQYQEVMLRLADPEFNQIATSAVRGDAALTDNQIRQFYFYAVTVLRIFEETFKQWREGTIAADRWESSEKTLNGIMRSPGYRACFGILRSNLDSDFVLLLESMVSAAPDAQPLDLATSWRAAVKNEEDRNKSHITNEA